MAELEQTDPVDNDLEERISANETLLRGLKYEYGQKMLRAQNGDDEYPSPFELAAISKLEGQLQNDKAFRQARRLTRRTA